MDDQLTAIREITEAARAFCEGLEGHPGPYYVVSLDYIRDRNHQFVAQRAGWSFTAKAICAALNHAPAGWDARLEALMRVGKFGQFHEVDWEDARVWVDRALALQRGEG